MQADGLVDRCLTSPDGRGAQEPERFVDSTVAAHFLSVERKFVLRLAREGKIPAYPLGDGQRRIWRFRLSEVAKAMEQRKVSERAGADAKKSHRD
jgi:excisionase family DNA binding protein